MWALLGFISAIFQGVYDIFKKISLKENAVIPVLIVATFSSFLILIVLKIACILGVVTASDSLLYIPSIDFHTHLLVVIKSIIVTISWYFSYLAMKHLPITIVTPIRATGPLWTLLGALVLFQERLNLLQWTGLIVTLICFYLFSIAGKKEGVHFRKNRWIGCIIVGTLTGAASGLYDKFLLKEVSRMAVQFWFPFYQLILLGLAYVIQRKYNGKESLFFKMKWSIPLIGIFLLISDFIYFYSLTYPEVLISVLSAVRRGGVFISFLFGVIILKDKNVRVKGVLLLGIMLGIMLLVFSSH